MHVYWYVLECAFIEACCYKMFWHGGVNCSCFEVVVVNRLLNVLAIVALLFYFAIVFQVLAYILLFL